MQYTPKTDQPHLAQHQVVWDKTASQGVDSFSILNRSKDLANNLIRSQVMAVITITKHKMKPAGAEPDSDQDKNVAGEPLRRRDYQSVLTIN